MLGSTFGSIFRVTTWGESHGKAMGVVIDGCPPFLDITEEEIQAEVDRRKPRENSAAATPRRESDQVQILSGVFEGKTTGTPISLMVTNENTRSGDYGNIQNLYRPGHADYTYDLKYGRRDFRGGGRSSGRETVSRVMAGAIAKKLLKTSHNTEIYGHTIQVGHLKLENFDKDFIEQSELRSADPKLESELLKLVETTKNAGDSLGAIIQIVIKNPPKGIGMPTFSKLDADLARAMLSIGAVKGFEIGGGFAAAASLGSENNDEMYSQNGETHFKTNNSGGILGGISTGEDIIIRLAIKPVSSIAKPQETIDTNNQNATIETHGRHDVCLAPRIIPVAEAMAALTLADHLLLQQTTHLQD